MANAAEVHGREATRARRRACRSACGRDETMTEPGMVRTSRAYGLRAMVTARHRFPHGAGRRPSGTLPAMTRDRRHPRRDRRGRVRRRDRRPAASRVLPRRGRAGRRAGDVRGRRRRPTRTRASRCTSTRCRCPSSRPTRRYVAVMASSINFNTVWTSIFEPLPTFGFLERLGKESVWGARHDQPYHVVGSDAAGVVLRVGSAVRNWKPGDAVTVHCNHVDDQDPSAHDDSMLATNQRIWGFETNFGGLAELTVVKANQLMPKPAHLTWEEAAVNALHQLHELPHAREPERRADDAGPDRAHLGCERRASARYACQYVLNGGGTPVGVVSSPERAALAARDGRASTSSTARPRATSSGPTSTPRTRASGAGSARSIRELVGRDPDIVFEHPGRQTMGASVFVCRARRHDHHVRGDQRLHDRVRQPLPLDEPEDAQGLPLRQLPRGVGGEPARSAKGKIHPIAVGGVPARGQSARPRTRCTTTCTRASSACSCLAPEGGPRRHRRPTMREQLVDADHAVPPPRTVEDRST